MLQLAFYAKSLADLAVLKNYVENGFVDVNHNSECYDYPMDLLDHLNDEHPDNCSVFFDTESLELGLEIAKKVHEINPKYRFNLFCCTACDAEELYYKGVTYFVNKPYHYNNISHCIDDVLAFFGDEKNRCIILKKKMGSDIYRFSEISYIMSDKRKVIFYSDYKHDEYYSKLDEIEQLLDDRFIRCHQSYIVNMDRIKIIVEDGLVLYDETFIPISRNRHYATKRKYLSYISGDKV